MQAWLIIGLLGIAAGQQIQERQDTQAAQNHQQVRKQTPPPALPPTPCCQPASTENQPRPANKAGNWREAFTPPTWSNWALVLVSIGAIIAALFTLRIIRRQTVATEVAANAARDNAGAALLAAQAMINAERAWLVPTMHDPTEINEPARSTLTLITNTGKTPAIIVERAHVGHCIKRDALLPEVPNYERGVKIMGVGVPLAPGLVLPITAGIEDRRVSERIKNEELLLYVYGFVKYCDILDRTKIHETRYCFRYFPKWEEDNFTKPGSYLTAHPNITRLPSRQISGTT